VAQQLSDVVTDGPPTYKPGDPNTLTYNYTGGISMGEGGESVTVPLGLYDSPAPGRTQGAYSMVMPQPGYKYAYDDKGFRYQVPEDYTYGDPNAPATQPTVTKTTQPLGPTTTTTPTTGNTMATTDVSDLPAYGHRPGAQQIVSGQPQSPQEVNIMDYYGTQADAPVLQPETQLAPQVEKVQVQQDELLGAPQLGDAPKVSYTGATAQQVGVPTAQGAVTGQTTLAGTVQEPEVTKTSAVQSFEQVDQEADAFQAAKLELGEVDPRATVQGQMALLQEQFQEGETPVWAQGAMKQASSLMAQRGLGSSTMAAEAITNALMQSTIPIAQQDASFYQSVTMQNLSNEQQAEMTKFNARLSSIFNDQAAENTARNINAQTENDTARFFSELSQNVVLANTSASNAMEQFNATARNQAAQFYSELGLAADQVNAEMANDMARFNGQIMSDISKFNSTMKNNREQFNVRNQIAIDTNNVQWRRSVNTANTSALNAAIQTDVQNLLGIQQTAQNNIWNHYDTILNMAFQAQESATDRATNVAIATIDAEMRKKIADDQQTSSFLGDIFEFGGNILSDGDAVDSIIEWWDS